MEDEETEEEEEVETRPKRPRPGEDSHKSGESTEFCHLSKRPKLLEGLSVIRLFFWSLLSSSGFCRYPLIFLLHVAMCITS